MAINKIKFDVNAAKFIITVSIIVTHFMYKKPSLRVTK